MAMKRVKVVVLASTPGGLRAWGEVKAVDQPGSPTVAHVDVVHGGTDIFWAAPGRYSLHFRVTAHGNVTISTEIDGVLVGPASSIDATSVTAGLRYHFEVPS
jgi:hypothetical protein